MDDTGGREQCKARDEACAEVFVSHSKWDIRMGLVVIARHACIVEAAADVETLIDEPELAHVQRPDGPEEDEAHGEEQCRCDDRKTISPSHKSLLLFDAALATTSIAVGQGVDAVQKPVDSVSAERLWPRP
jgi:hypothetical protein